MSKNEAPKAPDPKPEVKNAKETGGKTKETKAPKLPDLSPDNIGLVNRMTDRGKEIASKAFQSLEKIPGVDRTVGKLLVAYNQFWKNWNEKKAVGFKQQMDSLDRQISSMELGKERFQAKINEFEAKGMGVESLQLKLKESDQKRINLENKRAAMDSKLKARINNAKNRTNERDDVADRLINRFEGKLKPMEAELEKLKTNSAKSNLLIALTEAKHQRLESDLAKQERDILEAEKDMRDLGNSAKEIKDDPSLKIMRADVASGRKSIQAERNKILGDRNKINTEIARVDATANKYRDRREDFSRAKEDRPITFKVKAKEKSRVSTTRETPEAQTRQQAEAKKTEAQTGEEAVNDRTAESSKKEASAENENLKDMKSLVNGWNAYLIEKHGPDASANEQIDISDFTKKIGELGYSANFKIDFNNFKSILNCYLQLQDKPKEKYYQSIDAYYEDKLKP